MIVCRDFREVNSTAESMLAVANLQAATKQCIKGVDGLPQGEEAGRQGLLGIPLETVAAEAGAVGPEPNARPRTLSQVGRRFVPAGATFSDSV